MAATIKNVAAVVTTGSLALVYTCNASRGTKIESIQCANVVASNQTIDVSIRKSATDYYVIKNLVIPVGASIAVNADVLNLSSGDSIYSVVSSGSANGAHIIVSMIEFT